MTAAQAGNGNHAAATSVSQSFAVVKATLAITASSVSVPFNQVIPALTGFTALGFVNSDTTAALSGTPADFARRGSLAQLGLTAYQRHKETTQKDRGNDSQQKKHLLIRRTLLIGPSESILGTNIGIKARCIGFYFVVLHRIFVERLVAV